MRLAAALLAVSAAAAPAAGDILRPTLGQPIYEVSHSVDIAIKDGLATYKVRRVFANPGSRADEAGLEIDLPYGAAATGLRIRARDRWFDGELMEAEKAAALYRELTGMGSWKAKDPALLQWVWANKLYLQVFPVLPGQTSTVEYTLTVPTRYAGGQIFLSYPRLAARGSDQAGGGIGVDARLAAPILTVRPAWGDATTLLMIDGQRIAPDSPIVLAPPTTPPWLSSFAADPDLLYVGSALTIPAASATTGPFSKATVTLDVEHTWKSDLQIILLAPSGEAVTVFDHTGGDDNDVKGSFEVRLPSKISGAGTWRLVLSDNIATDAGTLQSWSLTLGDGKTPYQARAGDTPIFIPDRPANDNEAGLAAIVLAPPTTNLVHARLGKVVASTRHAFSRLEVDAAPELRPLPKKAQVVFAIDASHSMGQEGIDAQLAVARAYLSHVPDAEVEVVAYRRRATRVFGSFAKATAFDAAVATARRAGQLAPGNGSALDAGAELAAKLLAAPAHPELAAPAHPRRLVITTDRLLRSSFSNPMALAGLRRVPAGTIVHVVAPELDGSDVSVLTRDDADALAPIAAAHRGIFAQLTGNGVAGNEKRLRDAVLGLVRPRQIDQFAIRGLDLVKEGVPDTLREGDAVRAMLGLAAAPDRVVLTGKIWGDRFRREVKVDGRFSMATAGFVFGEDEYRDLSPPEMMKVAMMGRAVSPVTSYLAIEPGVRPSTEGIDRSTSGTSGFGSGSGAGHGYGGSRVPLRPPNLLALLAPAVSACAARHKPAPGWSVDLKVETTFTEVVDVIPATRTPMADCLVEAAWALRLDSAFISQRAMHVVTINQP